MKNKKRKAGFDCVPAFFVYLYYTTCCFLNEKGYYKDNMFLNLKSGNENCRSCNKNSKADWKY